MSEADPRWRGGDAPEQPAAETGGWPPPGSDPYAETGGWPPPSPEQRRYPAGGAPVPGPTGPAGAYGQGGTGPTGYGQGGAGAPGGIGWQPGDSRYGRLAGPGEPAAPAPAPRPRPRPGPVPTGYRRLTGAGNPLTLVLIAVNVVVYAIQSAVPGLTERYGLTRLDVQAGQYERLITSAFLHAGLLHLASNMLALYIVGAPLERAVGSVRLGVIYFASALGGSFLSLALSPPYSLGVGASGAIFGLFGAVAVLHRRIGADLRGIGVLIGLNLVISFAIPNISWQAHIGGLVTGVVVAALVAGRRPRAPARRPTPPRG